MVQGTGSSPLARGLLHGVGQVQALGRIIPARAGFTATCAAAWKLAADHPRSRGVYTSGSRAMPKFEGSSPLARGLLSGHFLLLRVDGIIPARAGFTRSAGRAISFPRDHPRSRGVYATAPAAEGRARGSSPLARGLRPARPRASRSRGIIPARAGFTARRRSPMSRCPDHPRSRGVYNKKMFYMTHEDGSSPLARGLPESAHHSPAGRGIIPARAGFTASRLRRHRGQRDHPRSRGVYSQVYFNDIVSRGSSPLARGLQHVGEGVVTELRIIPARAGFTGSSLSSPRLRPGSSPLARGLP